MNVGFAIVVAGCARSRRDRDPQAGGCQLARQARRANKRAGDAVVSIATLMLTEIAGAFLVVGVPLILAAWFAGPAHLP